MAGCFVRQNSHIRLLGRTRREGAAPLPRDEARVSGWTDWKVECRAQRKRSGLGDRSREGGNTRWAINGGVQSVLFRRISSTVKNAS